MYVVKSDGEKEKVAFDKITTRIQKLCFGLDEDFIDVAEITQKVIAGLFPGVSTKQVDTLTCELLASMITRHPDFSILAARVAVSNLHKEIKPQFSKVVEELYEASLVSKELYDLVKTHKDKLDVAICHDCDYSYTYFGFKTLENAYLLRRSGEDKILERPQHLLMRVAIGIHGGSSDSDVDNIIETYKLMSEKWFTHSTPTLFNAGTPKPQMSSCFLLTTIEDSIPGIYKTLMQCAQISKYSGGIGLNVHCVRGKGSPVAGTNGTSNGIVPMLRVFNNTAKYVDQGGNKRPGGFAIYLEPWHSDIFEFLNLKRNVGTEEQRARDLFYGLWIPDLFMKRVENNETWSLMCPNECPDLCETWGDKFEDLYRKYEQNGRYKRQVQARDVWYAIIESQIETGTPYMLYKDHCNKKSNQQNLGTIKCSNLCTEIIEYSSADEIAVCNLASIALNRFVIKSSSGLAAAASPSPPLFHFLGLKEVVKVVTRNLNKIIDRNFYPISQSKVSNLRHRPIGIGVQGLADTFVQMRFPYDSEQARKLNVQIFETIYYGALEASCELAKAQGPYETFKGSPAAFGVLQYDMWNVKPTDLWDWDSLKKQITQYGLRNSLLVALMPTATTAQILGNNESFEPFTNNIYTRRVLSGEFQVVNQYLLKDLIQLGLWNEDTKQAIIANNGSVQSVPNIPDDLKELYRTVWEIPQKSVIQMAADRSPFVDQSQSMNIHLAEPDYGKISSMHFYGWKLGLKTGMYYLRTKPAAHAIQFTVSPSPPRLGLTNKDDEDNKIVCFSCAS